MTFEYGQIILAHVPDGHGHMKPHPAVILTPTDQIRPGESLRVVCVSTQIERPSPSHHVPLPWMRPRHPRTGLDRPNVAKCNWLAKISEADVIKVIGFAPPAQLSRIEDELRKLMAGGP